MSAGQNVRRYGFITTIPPARTSETDPLSTAWVILMAVLVLTMVLMLSDGAVASTIARSISALWTDLVRLIAKS
jgi:hypothetical protein